MFRDSLAATLDKANDSREAADTVLTATTVLDRAQNARALALLRTAYGYVQFVRVVADGKVLVRFFDGAGNEIDVTTKTQVVFVASDASRFMEALRQLAEDETATKDLLATVLGPRIREARAVAAQTQVLEQRTAAVSSYLTDLDSKLVDAPPAPDLRRALVDAARTVAGTGIHFANGDDIRNFVKGMTAQ